MASENDKAPGASDTSKKGEPSKLHIAGGDRGTFVAPEIPKTPENVANTGGPAEAIKGPTHEATKLHIAEGDRGKTEIHAATKRENAANDLRAADVPKVEHSRDNAGGPAAAVPAPVARPTDVHVAKSEKNEARRADIPKKAEPTKNTGGPVKAPEKAKATPKAPEPPPERLARKPAVVPKPPASAKNTGGPAAKGPAAKAPATKVTAVAKRSDRNLPAAVKKAVGAVAVAAVAAKSVAMLAKAASSFKPPTLPGFQKTAVDASSSMKKLSLTPEGGSAITFQYNPTQFSLDRTVSWEDSRAMKEPYGILSFTGGASDTVNFSAMIDHSEDPDGVLLDDVDLLYALTRVSIKETNYARPPITKLAWGTLSFVGVVTALKLDFTMFSEAGVPLRATVTVTMMGRSFTTDADAQKAKFFAPFS
jgi:hypothetical protein